MLAAAAACCLLRLMLLLSSKNSKCGPQVSAAGWLLVAASCPWRHAWACTLGQTPACIRADDCIPSPPCAVPAVQGERAERALERQKEIQELRAKKQRAKKEKKAAQQ